MKSTTPDPTARFAGSDGLEPTSIPAVLARRLLTGPTDEVLVDEEHHSVADLDRESGRYARALLASGVGLGHRVGILVPNRAEWAVIALGALRVGATVVPISTRYSPSESAELIDRAGVGWVVASTRFLGRDYAAELRQQGVAAEVIAADDGDAELTNQQFLDRGIDVDDAAQAAAERAVGPDTPAFVQFTSGTTGAPKGAILRHGALVTTTREWIQATTLRVGDRYAVVAPFFHISGYKTGLLACLLSGAVAHPVRQFKAGALLDLVEQEAITVLQGPPTLYLELIHLLESDGPRDVSSLRVAVTGGTVVPAAVVRAMRSTLGFDTIITSYGLTEASGVVTICSPDDPDEVIGATSGRPIPSATVSFRPLSADEEHHDGGEILVRSAHLMDAYLDDPAATAAAIDPDGWLHTGDIGRLDEAGNLVITGRLTDMFIVGGFNAYPAEIEAVIEAHPAVAAAAVIGVADERLGEVGAAFVVTHDGVLLGTEQLRDWCQERLAGFKVPRTCTQIDALPLNAVGKVDKPALRARWVAPA